MCAGPNDFHLPIYKPGNPLNYMLIEVGLEIDSGLELFFLNEL